MNQGSLYISIEQHVGKITFSHPASNSMPSELLLRLANAFHELDKNNDVHVVLLQSEGDTTFCAGASFHELVAIENLAQGQKFFMGFANVINAMRTCSKIIIGKAQGKAVGGGVGLLAACDFVLASENSSIKLSEIAIGIGPFVIEPVVTRKIGIAAFLNLTLQPTQWQTAYWAKEKGLYNHVYETHTELEKEVDLFTHQLAQYNSEALNKIKTITWEGTDNWSNLLQERALISGKLVLSDFTKNALKNYKK